MKGRLEGAGSALADIPPVVSREKARETEAGVEDEIWEISEFIQGSGRDRTPEGDKDDPYRVTSCPLFNSYIAELVPPATIFFR